MALDHSCQVQRHPLSERGLDAYGTPPAAVKALLRVEKLPHTIWEPCSGRGNVASVLRHHGHAVVCSDVHEYDGFNLHFVGDFLKQTEMPAGVQAICTNPPYSLCARSAPFVQHALDLAPTVILLMRLAFLESEARCSILEERGLRAIHVFRLRLPMMHREGWQGRKSNSGMAFAWMKWDRGYTGPTIIDRISWER
jgi:hypothetical protein